MAKNLLVLIGPTGVGKTELSLQLAERYDLSVINADSRQLYRGLPIGTAAPTSDELQRVKHYFVQELSLEDYYSAARYEEEVLALLDELFCTHDVALLSGGSMLYIDAVCKGIDELPTVDATLRASLIERYRDEGLDSLRRELELLDPDYCRQADLKNPKRIIHALEICYMTGKPYSSLRTQSVKKRPFHILKIGLQRERSELYERIGRRVDAMMEAGLLEEARALYPMRHLNALNTVGYKELFAFLDGECTQAEAVEKIKRNTRVYSRKQMTWFKRDPSVHWFHPNDREALFRYVDEQIRSGE